MLNNLLLEGMTNVQTGLFTFLLGMAVTFLGMAVLVICVTLVGKAISSKSDKEPSEGKVEEVQPATVNADEGDIPLDIKLAIIAAVTTACIADSGKTKNEFVVRRIKRIK